MVEYIEIESYTHAEKLGIKPIDSIIGVVIEKKTNPPYTIVGYVQGHTFLVKDGIRFDNLKIYNLIFNDYDLNNAIEIHAINDKIALMLANSRYNKPFNLFQVTTTYKKVNQ